MKRDNFVLSAAFGIGLFLTVSIVLWTVASLLTAYYYDWRGQEARWNEMLGNGKTIAVLTDNNAGNIDGLMKQLALLKQERLVLIDGTGNKLAFGGDQAISFASTIDQAEIDQVLTGTEIKKVKRGNVFQPGLATTGQAISIAGRPYALFIQADTESLFHDYGKQLVTVIVNLLLFLLLGLLASPKRKKQVLYLKRMIDAIRKMAKGDFNVTFETRKEHGPWGELAENLNHMAVELNQIEQMRQEFISNVSHEIQSPLTSINGFARALHNEQLSGEERKHYLEIIETESTRLSKLSDNLLKLTSLESQHHPFDPKPYRLDKQLRRLVLACEPQWLGKNIEMDVSLDELTLEADEDMMSQVWVNLLNNSIKFTPVDGTIGIHVNHQDGQAIVRISDTGIGISAEDQRHIFERFYKADKSRHRSGGGSGLGLSIVHNIIERHRGSITVQSRTGEGTTFTINLPLKASKYDKNALS
ncbi:HAMP domain-containing sensor histidine kinase [Paenibacillus sp. UNC451MF]|uniref:HAMP domain-containing sensor histidine kinase n=1 Tax=Paenibacillus sp. UNC451MF TaxID=1449063 RepID=UPI000AF2BC06|nr:ATP-binding protein [Paenibacillus sp. UNC451MF]